MSHLLGALVALALFSYPITTVALLAMDIPTGPANLLIKAGLATLYVAVLVKALRRGGRIPLAGLPLVAFFVVYAVRLTHDLLVAGVGIFRFDAMHVTAYYFLLTVLPCLALLTAYRDIDVRALYAWLLPTLALANFALIINVLTGDVVDVTLLLSARAEVAGDEAGTAILSPLTFGLSGACLCILVLGRLCLVRTASPRQTFGLLLLAGLGVINLLLGGSRGPLVALVLLLLLLTAIALLRRGAVDAPGRLAVLGFLSVPTLVMVGATLLAPAFLFERVVDFLSDRATGFKEERDFVLAAAFDDFVNSPIIGRAFVTSYDSSYPHNIPLEVLMSTGIAGGVLYATAIAIFLLSAARIFRSRRGGLAGSIVLVALCQLLFGMTSGSIYWYPEYWIQLSLVICIGSRISAQEYPTTTLGNRHDWSA